MRTSLLAASFVLLLGSAPAQTVSGIVFADLDRDGVHDFGEPYLEGLPVTIFGNDGTVDVTTSSAADGSWSHSVATGAKYVLGIDPGPDWRFSFQDLGADAAPIPDWPQGRRRPSVLDHLVANLRAASTSTPLVHVALGDSIAYGFNLCDSPLGQNDYVTPITARLDGVQAASLSKLAILAGAESATLLDPTGSGTVFDAIAGGAQLVTISIGGNDYLEDDGNAALTAANLVACRQNLQEILSTLVSELPDCDVVINTIYDNEAGDDAFHDTWGPIWNQCIRDVAWGQMRRVGIAEVWPDYEHKDPASGLKLGEPGLICHFLHFDSIHPKKRGYDLHEEKVWQALGGVNVDVGTFERDFGFLERIDTRFPTTANDVGGGASNESAAFAQDDVGALIPGGTQELRLDGFDSTPRGLLEQVVVRIRYRTNGPPSDDTYRFEASVDGTYAAPGTTATTWNTVVPIVGSAANGIPVLAFPDQPEWRDVSALVSKGAAGDGSATVSWQDLSTLSVRLKGATAGAGADAFDVEWDVASIDLYGVPPYRLMLRGSPRIGETLQFDATGREGDDDWIFVSSGTGNAPFPPWGTFEIDLTSFLLFGGGQVGPTGAHTILAGLPNDPSLIGATIYVQSLIVESYKPKVGALTNSASVTFEP